MCPFCKYLEVAVQILGRKFYKNTKKSSLYSQNILSFIHKIPVVQNHPATREFEIYYGPGPHDGKHGLFLHEQLARLHSRNTQTKLQT